MPATPNPAQLMYRSRLLCRLWVWRRGVHGLRLESRSGNIVTVAVRPPPNIMRAGPSDDLGHPGWRTSVDGAWVEGTLAGIFARPGAKRRWMAVVLRRAGGALLGLTLLATSALAQDEPNDPLEPLNRRIFQFNRVVDGLVLEPAARIYRMATPQFVRTGVRNFLANLGTPVVLANDLLQGEFERAELTLGRFLMNTILGLGGVIDVGGKLGMPPRHYEDFGQTLAVYGVGSGPYLMLPLLGPSNGRDPDRTAPGIAPPLRFLFLDGEECSDLGEALGIDPVLLPVPGLAHLADRTHAAIVVEQHFFPERASRRHLPIPRNVVEPEQQVLRHLVRIGKRRGNLR